MCILASDIQHNSGCSSQCSKVRKCYKSIEVWKEEIKLHMLTACLATQNNLELTSSWGKLQDTRYTSIQIKIYNINYSCSKEDEIYSNKFNKTPNICILKTTKFWRNWRSKLEEVRDLNNEDVYHVQGLEGSAL